MRTTEPDDIQRLMNLLDAVADDILNMTDEEVAAEFAALAPMVPSVGKIIIQAIARATDEMKASDRRQDAVFS